MHPNGKTIKEAYDAFGRGDMPTVFGILDKGIQWHVPGQSRLSGDYRGHDEVMGFFKKCMELSEGTLRIDVHDLVANDSTVFVLCTVSATRAGQRGEFLEVHLWRMVNGRPVEFREFQGDEYTENKFCTCPLLAQSRHWSGADQCPLSGVKRTSELAGRMSAFDPERTLLAIYADLWNQSQRRELGAVVFGRG